MLKLEKKKPKKPYYLSDGTGPLPGASTICKLGDDPGGLIHWAYKKGLAGEDYRTERDAAADAGTIAHAKIEAFLIGEDLEAPDFSEESNKLGEASFKKFLKWWVKNGFHCLYSELWMVSEKKKYGGTLDIFARDRYGLNCLIDLKRTKSVHVSHGIQVVGGYRPLIEENLDYKVEKACILRLPADKKVAQPLWIDPANFWYYENVFLKALDLYWSRSALITADPQWKPKPWFNRNK